MKIFQSRMRKRIENGDQGREAASKIELVLKRLKRIFALLRGDMLRAIA